MARGLLSSFTFHRSFVLPTLAVVKIFSSRTQPVRALSTPSVRKSGRASDRGRAQQNDDSNLRKSHSASCVARVDTES